jgi:hypothetical protein
LDGTREHFGKTVPANGDRRNNSYDTNSLVLVENCILYLLFFGQPPEIRSIPQNFNHRKYVANVRSYSSPDGSHHII